MWSVTTTPRFQKAWAYVHVRLYKLLWAFLVFLFITSTIFAYESHTFRDAIGFPQHTYGYYNSKHRHDDNGKLRIWLVEGWGTHDEVSTALMHAFGNQKDAELKVFLRQRRFNIEEIHRHLDLAAPLAANRGLDEFAWAVRREPAPHIIVSTTCDGDMRRLRGHMRMLLKESNTHVICVFHHPDWFKGDLIDYLDSWVMQDRVDFVGLSNHTAEFMAKNIIPKYWPEKDPAVRVFPPVFPVKRDDEINVDDVFLAMQGDYDPNRRNYKGIFDSLGLITKKVKSVSFWSTKQSNKTVSLHAIGHGKKPEVPSDVKDQVFFDENLEYPDFYRVLSKAYAVLPAFATDDYLVRKASSSIPASMIAGVPIVANEEILQAYSYVPRETVWLSTPKESEFETIARIAVDHEAEFREKRELVRNATTQLIKDNIHNAQIWIKEARDHAKTRRPKPRPPKGKTSKDKAII